MMKKILKGLGVLVAGGLAIGLVWYFQALKIDGDPLLTTCWAVDIYDDITGEKVVGAEDLDFDPETGTVFLSAYDRRAVAREIDAGEVTTQGGIYTFKVSDITDAGTLNVTDISRDFKEAGNEFRPHGFVFVPNKVKPRLIFINRVYTRTNGKSILEPNFVWVSLLPEGLVYYASPPIPEACDPNDVIFTGSMLIATIAFTDITGHCENGVFDSNGSIKLVIEDPPKIVEDELFFPNGIIQTKNFLAVAQTTDYSIAALADQDSENEIISLPIAPDNLTIDANENLYVAGFPNLLDYYFYIEDLLGVKKSPSAAYRISPDDYAQELLYKDDGTMISGATVAQRAGDYLILGSGWDDNIAICSGMDRLD